MKRPLIIELGGGAIIVAGEMEWNIYNIERLLIIECEIVCMTIGKHKYVLHFNLLFGGKNLSILRRWTIVER